MTEKQINKKATSDIYSEVAFFAKSLYSYLKSEDFFGNIYFFISIFRINLESNGCGSFVLAF